MTYLELLKLLLPHGCYTDSGGSSTDKDLSVHAGEIETCQTNADALFTEIFPETSYALLADWENTYGIVFDIDISYGTRIDNLLTKISAIGGESLSYFISLAAGLGYTISIDEFVPFMAGWNEAGDKLYKDEIVYCWQVNAAGISGKSQYFESGISCAGDSLNYFSEAFLEKLFQKLKPAHTACIFNYT